MGCRSDTLEDKRWKFWLLLGENGGTEAVEIVKKKTPGWIMEV